jgi:hypothetical protein
MTLNGEIVPFSNPGAAGKVKRADQPQKRQVPVDEPSMTLNGEIVPFSNPGAAGKK